MNALLVYLDGLTDLVSEHTWSDWLIRPIASGNNRLFRVTHAEMDYAVKFCIRDERDRARREYAALELLEKHALHLVPTPVLIDQTSYHLPVVVTTWITGTSAELLQDDGDMWNNLVKAHYAVNQISAEEAEKAGIRNQSESSTIKGQFARIARLWSDIPQTGHSTEIGGLIDKLMQANFPESRITLCMCHGDANLRNYLLTPTGRIAMVDWEYSCIDDPASQIASLITHPIARHVKENRWRQMIDAYVALSADGTLRERIEIQCRLWLVWWVLRLIFGKTVLLQRPSRRLVGYGPEAEISNDENIAWYIDRANKQLDL